MRVRVASGVLALLCLAAVSVLAGPPLSVQDDPDSIAAAMDALVPELLEKAYIPGLAVAVIRDGRVVWDGAYGVRNVDTGEPVTHETVFEAASLTKPLFAYAVMHLVEDGKIDLDKPIIDYLDLDEIESFLDHPVTMEGFEFGWFKQITARHLLSHSSGLPHGERARPYPLQFAPGSDYRYSAEGYRLLQLAVEKLTRSRATSLVEKTVLKPLGMTRTSLVWRDEFGNDVANGHDRAGDAQSLRRYTEPHAAASLYTTAADYAKFVCAVLNDTGLDETTVRDMLEPQIAVGDSVSWALGFGLQNDENGTAFWQWGDYVIFRNFVLAYPRQKTGVVYLTNSNFGLSVCERLVQEAVGGDVRALPILGYPQFDAPIMRFVRAVEASGAEAAIAMLPDLRRDHPDAITEGEVNQVGYMLLFTKNFDDAIALFELNVQEHPASANVYDSLGEAYMTRGAIGDIDRAVENYQRALAILDDDPNISASFRETLRRNATERLAELQSLEYAD